MQNDAFLSLVGGQSRVVLYPTYPLSEFVHLPLRCPPVSLASWGVLIHALMSSLTVRKLPGVPEAASENVMPSVRVGVCVFFISKRALPRRRGTYRKV